MNKEVNPVYPGEQPEYNFFFLLPQGKYFQKDPTPSKTRKMNTIHTVRAQHNKQYYLTSALQLYLSDLRPPFLS